MCSFLSCSLLLLTACVDLRRKGQGEQRVKFRSKTGFGIGAITITFLSSFAAELFFIWGACNEFRDSRWRSVGRLVALLLAQTAVDLGGPVLDYLNALCLVFISCLLIRFSSNTASIVDAYWSATAAYRRRRRVMMWCHCPNILSCCRQWAGQKKKGGNSQQQQQQCAIVMSHFHFAAPTHARTYLYPSTTGHFTCHFHAMATHTRTHSSAAHANIQQHLLCRQSSHQLNIFVLSGVTRTKYQHTHTHVNINNCDLFSSGVVLDFASFSLKSKWYYFY